MTTDLVVIIPSRGRPGDVERMALAFAETGADEVAVVWAIEADDPEADAYEAAVAEWFAFGTVERLAAGNMVRAINLASAAVLDDLDPYAIAVLNDDHVPRTAGWHTQLVNALRTFHPAVGMVYPDDGHQGKKLSTVWAVSSEWVRLLNRMIPARVEHLYADNAMMNLAESAGCVTYLPSVLIEHMHPAAGKAADTAQYREVNSREANRRDRATFTHWRGSQRREGKDWSWLHDETDLTLAEIEPGRGFTPPYVAGSYRFTVPGRPAENERV